ncbi:UV-B-induced protein At3g17800, chloroplastic-like [Rutidosis leptorrhynchoides]|uniref:UV-B-induced protein At3g17800, chloroplastic-like n=1 Tax=Rutidosis leptorrhynchoides TaxID=125765 RepID=UPI003A99521C
MEYTLSSSFTTRFLTVSSPANTTPRFAGNLKSFSPFKSSVTKRCRLVVASYCEFSSLNTPIEPVTPAGRFLSSVLLNERKSFHDAVAETLEKLVNDVDEANKRTVLTADSTEACLHRRIAELKERECKIAIEDVMYMLILYKFYELKVHIIPRLSKCIYNNRLEILPSKDWELESIHSFEVLEMIRQHLTSVTGWRSDFSVTDSWATTQIKRADLSQLYTSSILFGYFLKSATLRHQLEMSLVDPIGDMVFNTFRRMNLVFGDTLNTMMITTTPFDGKKKREKLSSYLMGFSPDSLTKCAQPNSKEALNLIAKHSLALFGDVESDKVISTSFATLKRFGLEAIAFGSFLWDTEEYVNTVYNLEENN